MPFRVVGPLLPAVARRAIRCWIDSQKWAEPGSADHPRAPVFVTLRAPDGSLRGCIGSVRATEPDVVHETARSAVLAAASDPRFLPVHRDELPGLHIEVSVLGAEEPVDDVRDLEPAKYGVIVRDGNGRQGLLLPGIPGVDDAHTQLELARRKGGFSAVEPVRISRFCVEKWSDRGGAS